MNKVTILCADTDLSGRTVEMRRFEETGTYYITVGGSVKAEYRTLRQAESAFFKFIFNFSKAVRV